MLLQGTELWLSVADNHNDESEDEEDKEDEMSDDACNVSSINTRCLAATLCFLPDRLLYHRSTLG